MKDQHLVFLFPTKVEQFVHVHFEQQQGEEFLHPLDQKNRKTFEIL